MTSAFIRKLEFGADLSEDARHALNEAASDVRDIGARQDLIREGDRPDNVHLLVEGWAYRYKFTPDGGRQILAYLIPGDFCDLHVAILGEMDHGIATLSTSKVAHISPKTVDSLTAEHPSVNRALWWATLVDEGVLREWLASMGRKPADKQMAHLFCELLVRMQSVGLTSDDSYEFPVTQAELGDTLGISEVHVNRMLQQLRADGLIEFEGKKLTVLDVERLKRFADFDPNYLHLTKRSNAGAGMPSARMG
jgi:CRP-like cAMP-binding protein